MRGRVDGAPGRRGRVRAGAGGRCGREARAGAGGAGPGPVCGQHSACVQRGRAAWRGVQHPPGAGGDRDADGRTSSLFSLSLSFPSPPGFDVAWSLLRALAAPVQFGGRGTGGVPLRPCQGFDPPKTRARNLRNDPNMILLALCFCVTAFLPYAFVRRLSELAADRVSLVSRVRLTRPAALFRRHGGLPVGVLIGNQRWVGVVPADPLPMAF